MITLTDVTKQYDGSSTPAVEKLSLTIDAGTITVLVGPSGCGKTTTLKMINRLIEPTSGDIRVGGNSVINRPPHELRREIGYVIQHIGLFPHKTIRKNIATVPQLLGWDTEEIETRVDELIELVDLDEDMLDRYPHELSGGQRQRVGVARALAADPPVMLMDEPFGAVDPIVRAKLQDEFLDLQRRVQKTIVLVTHDIDEAVKLGDKVAILNVGGVLEQYDTPDEILSSPANDFVRSFLGSDRGLKRLGLFPIETLQLDSGPFVGVGVSTAVARSVAQSHGSDWIGILAEDDTLLGWSPLDVLPADGIVTDAAEHFQSWVDCNDSLRDALEVIISSHTRIAAVLDGDTFKGIVTLDQIYAEIVS
jgi:osmoprotectant transport system ATP-binding protein